MQTSQLTKIIKALLYCLALTPLIITPMTIFPFNFGRGLIVQLLIEIIFGLYFVLAIFNKDYRPKRNPLFIALGIFMGVMFLASIFGVDFNKSFWGNEERFTGWFYLVHILLLFIVLSSALKDKKEWRRFLSFNVFVSLVMFGIAILSLWGIKFWGVDLGSRISGTLGNPIFIGSYFILNLLLSGYLFFNYRSLGQETLSQQVPPLEKGRAGGIYKFIIKSALIPLFQRGRREGGIYKLFFGASSLILLVGIFLTQSRGAILGMVFGIFIGAVYFCIFNKNKKIKKIILSALVIFIILGGLVFALREQNFIKENAILNRITSISLAKGTGNTRILGWEVALKGIVDRPFLGWGQENFHIAFNKYYNPELLKYSYYETWFDKPHNIVLEMGINGGIFGVLSYLGIFGAGFFLLHKKKDIFSLPERAVIFGGSVAYFAQNLFAFDTPVSLLLFVVVLGLISGLREGGERENRKIALTPLVATVIIILIFGWILNIKPLLASAELRRTTLLYEVGQKNDVDGYKSAMQLFNPYKEEWRDDLAKSIISDLRLQGNFYSDEEIFYGISELQKNVIEHPNNAYNHMLLGIFYTEMLPKDKKYLESANKEFEKALALSSKRQHIYFAMGRYYVLFGDIEGAKQMYQKAIDLEPNASVAYWEGGKNLLLMDESDELGEKLVIKAFEMGFQTGEKNEILFLFTKFSEKFLNEKKYKALAGLYENMQIVEPNNAKWSAQTAMSRYLEGDYVSALRAIEIAIEIDESYREEGEAFIKMIENHETNAKQ